MSEADAFMEESAAPPPAARFVVDLEGFEGPVDVLLALAREQKVDLKQISILALADQYLAFIADLSRANLEVAADYLVMAAWLAYLKSRLLLPDLGAEGEPTAEELAEALQFQLRRLEAMQRAGAALMARALLGRDVFARGRPEEFPAIVSEVFELTLYDFLKAYAEHRRRKDAGTLTIAAEDIYTVEEALKRLRRMLLATKDWESLWRFLPPALRGGFYARSALASTFAATLELARQGMLNLRQSGAFGPIYVRPAAGRTPGPVAVAGETAGEGRKP
jgi:segregation and condensation protein A